MSLVTTMDPLLWPLMEGPTVVADHCLVCGRRGHLEQHHVVRRSAGQLVVGGRRLTKPTITLCGLGNTSGCHGLAHAMRLHFRVTDGWWEYLLTDEPTRYDAALDMEGWRQIRRPR